MDRLCFLAIWHEHNNSNSAKLINLQTNGYLFSKQVAFIYRLNNTSSREELLKSIFVLIIKIRNLSKAWSCPNFLSPLKHGSCIWWAVSIASKFISLTYGIIRSCILRTRFRKSSALQNFHWSTLKHFDDRLKDELIYGFGKFGNVLGNNC